MSTTRIIDQKSMAIIKQESRPATATVKPGCMEHPLIDDIIPMAVASAFCHHSPRLQVCAFYRRLRRIIS